MKYLVVVSLLLCGCLRKGIDVNVDIGIDECFTSYPECSVSEEGGFDAYCVGPDGLVARGCHPACLLGLSPIMSCPLEGQCYNSAAGQTIEVPVVCTRF